VHTLFETRKIKNGERTLKTLNIFIQFYLKFTVSNAVIQLGLLKLEESLNFFKN